ncbi:hypothetical protein B0H13DRAFT_2494769 [Mycena leptocephala]|nr:hypothetical protein B0H13DRAFT_2494769 [Mycena leptocephala]
MRLARVLVAAIVATEKTYLEALETGLLSASDVHTAEMLPTLELKASAIREGTLRNSLSLGSTFREFFAGRTFTLLLCIREVRALETHIEKPDSAETTYTHLRIARGWFHFADAVTQVPFFEGGRKIRLEAA